MCIRNNLSNIEDGDRNKSLSCNTLKKILLVNSNANKTEFDELYQSTNATEVECNKMGKSSLATMLNVSSPQHDPMFRQQTQTQSTQTHQIHSQDNPQNMIVEECKQEINVEPQSEATEVSETIVELKEITIDEQCETSSMHSSSTQSSSISFSEKCVTHSSKSSPQIPKPKPRVKSSEIENQTYTDPITGETFQERMI